MSKLLPKVGISTPKPRSVGGNAPQTWATTAALATNNMIEQSIAPSANPGEGDVILNSPVKVYPSNTDTSQSDAFCHIAEMLAAVIQSGKLDTPTKQSVVKVIKLAREAESKGEARELRGGEKEKVSPSGPMCPAILVDLVNLYNSLEKKIYQVQESCKAILDNTGRVLTGVEEAKTGTKALASKVSKVTEATDKIASDTNSYRDALLSKPMPSNKTATDPKVLSDMDHKAKQILVTIWDKDDNNILTKSLTSMTEKANKAIAGIEDPSKPKDIKVTAALKMHSQAVLLILNSKEAASWIREPLNEIEFTKGFSPESHIRERSFNLIAPRVLVTFDPSEEKHLCEIEEMNCLDKNAISRAKWIKPLGRRKLGQTNAYTIITLSSADSANILIRDGLYICGIKVRPMKQKQEPIQCMKCRDWGHFASKCPSEKDVCGNCREEHRTSACKNKDKWFCVTCKEAMHASWSRDCPEFNRRCLIFDRRNPENAMPYFPTEHDWTLTVRPSSIPMEDRFPARYTVNTLPTLSGRQQDPRSC